MTPEKIEMPDGDLAEFWGLDAADAETMSAYFKQAFDEGSLSIDPAWPEQGRDGWSIVLACFGDCSPLVSWSLDGILSEIDARDGDAALAAILEKHAARIRAAIAQPST